MPSKSNAIDATPALIFVDVLRQERIRRNLSPQQLAKKLDLHPHIIDDWETGKRYPRLLSAIRWAQALGVGLKLDPANRP